MPSCQCARRTQAASSQPLSPLPRTNTGDDHECRHVSEPDGTPASDAESVEAGRTGQAAGYQRGPNGGLKDRVKGRRECQAESGTPPPLTLFNTLITVQKHETVRRLLIALSKGHTAHPLNTEALRVYLVYFACGANGKGYYLNGARLVIPPFSR